MKKIVIITLFLFCITPSLYAGVYNGEIDVYKIKWENSQKVLNCNNKHFNGKMYLTEGGGSTYAFSNFLIACHNLENKKKASWIIAALSKKHSYEGTKIKNTNIVRYKGYPKYIVGSSCWFSQDGWRCNDYSLVLKNGLDVSLGKSVWLLEQHPFSASKVAYLILEENKVAKPKTKTKTKTKTKIIKKRTTYIPVIPSSSYRTVQTFHGYDCIDDCSGHEIGYEWAMDNDINNSDDCDGNSNSFNEGCMVYVDENY